ncbi:MAG TPA: hypothetical protein VL551_16975 [Actinospica sp.]|nr:hypothetical protein [Actinospica sp.]
MKKNPTKADLAAAVAKLTQESAQMRDLLAAISLAAGTVPISAGNDYLAEWKRSTKVLSTIKAVAVLDDDWAGSAAWGARYAREVAAEPVGYEVYQPEGDEPEPEPEPEAQECTDYDPAYKLHGCELGPHPAAKPHRDLLGVEWTESLEFPCPSKGCTLHLGHHPARHRDAGGSEWTDEVYYASGPRKPQVAAVAS